MSPAYLRMIRVVLLALEDENAPLSTLTVGWFYLISSSFIYIFKLFWKKKIISEFLNKWEVITLKLCFNLEKWCYKTRNTQFLVKSVFLTQCHMPSFTSSFTCNMENGEHVLSQSHFFHVCRRINPLLRKVCDPFLLYLLSNTGQPAKNGIFSWKPFHCFCNS